jgi:Tim17/Tim22/Tim23/Pmp24 family
MDQDPNKMTKTEEVYQINNLLCKSLEEKEEWKYVLLKTRPVPPVPLDYWFSSGLKHYLNCGTSVLMSVVGGYVVGCLFGLFMHINDNQVNDTKLSFATNAKVYFKDIKARCNRQGRSFAMFGGLIFSFECPIELYRGTHDSINGFLAGGLTGFILSVNRKSSFKGILGSTISSALMIGLIGFFLDT